MKAPASGAVWLQQPRPGARYRLFCLPYAGAGAGAFRGWDQGLSPDIEVCPVQLPGREWRRHEPPCRRMDALVDLLLDELSPWLSQDIPFALFGYSMGAAVAYSLACRLRDSGAPQPERLIVAACRAPELLPRITPIYTFGDDDFLQAIRRFGGMPEAILNEPELLQMVLPILRADFEILGTYRPAPLAPLPIPLIAYGGTADPHASRAELAEWRAQTSRGFTLRLFSGGHFFINEARGQLLRTLNADLAEALPQAEPRSTGELPGWAQAG